MWGDNGKAFCIEGMSDGSKYNENANALKNIYGVQSDNNQAGYYEIHQITLDSVEMRCGLKTIQMELYKSVIEKLNGSVWY